jgi:hypothetical protein
MKLASTQGDAVLGLFSQFNMLRAVAEVRKTAASIPVGQVVPLLADK